MNIYPGAELWRRVYELGNQVGKLWRLKHRSVKRTEKPSFPRCAYKTTDQPHGYPPCGRPAEHCETEPPLQYTWTIRAHTGFVGTTPNSGTRRKSGELCPTGPGKYSATQIVPS